jgi:hypothetical protein
LIETEVAYFAMITAVLVFREQFFISKVLVLLLVNS